MVLTLAAGSLSAGFGQPPAEEDPPPEWLIRNVIRWTPLIERWQPDFPELDPALVLAVMAQESQGNPFAEAGDGWGSVGLMQVIPRSWTGTRTRLLNPAYNIYVGMRMLNFSTEKWGVRLGLAHYNCSEEGVRNDACGSKGGLNYADRILEYWLPVFQAELVRAGLAQPTPTTTPERVAPPKATLTPTMDWGIYKIRNAEGTVETRPVPPQIFKTYTPRPTATLPPILRAENSNREVIDRSPVLSVVTGVIALIAIALVTILDLRRLGGKR